MTTPLVYLLRSSSLDQGPTERLGHAKIRKLHDSLRVDQDIGQLQVSVHDEVLVQMENRVQQLKHDALDIALSKEVAVERQHVHQVSQVHVAVLKDEENALALGSNDHFLQVYDVRVRRNPLQLFQDVDLSQ